MYNFFSLGWVVTLACIQGLILKKGVFLRTPKSKGQSKMWSALRVTQWEAMIGLLFLGCGLAAFIVRPEFKTFWLGLLLAWQASLFLAAPYFSLLSVQTLPVPQQRQPMLDRGQAVAENFAARWVWGGVVVLVIAAFIAFQIPLPTRLPNYALLQPPTVPPELLIGINPTPAPVLTATPLPSQTPTGTLPPSPTAINPTTTASITATPSETLTATPDSLTPTPTGAAPTSTASVTQSPLCTPTSTMTPSTTPPPFPPTAAPLATPGC
jgi:hypothetical protein